MFGRWGLVFLSSETDVDDGTGGQQMGFFGGAISGMEKSATEKSSEEARPWDV